MLVSSPCWCRVQIVLIEDNLKLAQSLLHQPVVHVVSAVLWEGSGASVSA